MHVVARGALIGGGVGLALAVARKGPDRGRRAVKSALEGALAGAAVGFFLDRSLRHRAGELVAANAPMVIDAVAELAQRYEPVVERLAEAARDRAVEAYEAARPRVEEAVGAVRSRALDLRVA